MAFVGLYALTSTSCSLFTTHHPYGKNGLELLQPFCLEMQGKGRLETEQTKQAFSYKSFFRGEHIFILIADIPFHGEEDVVVDLKTKAISGSLIKHSTEPQSLQHFFRLFLPFLSYRNTLKEHRAHDCHVVKQNAFEQLLMCDFMEIKKNDKKVQLTLIDHGEQKSRVTFWALNSFYRRAKWEDLSSKRKWALEFFLSDCTLENIL